MTQPDSAAIMDAIFASDEEEGRARLLKIMQDFLISESEKHTAKEKGKSSTSSRLLPLTSARIRQRQEESQ